MVVLCKERTTAEQGVTVDILQVIQVATLAPSLFFVGYQVLLQRRQARHQTDVQRFKLYHLLTQQYADLLLRPDNDPALNGIWEPVAPARAQELDKAQAERLWGAWYTMNDAERRCYRYVRSILETFEQAHQLDSHGWMDGETSTKWREWMAIWPSVRYFKYVFQDSKPRLVATFVERFLTFAQVTDLFDGDVEEDQRANQAGATAGPAATLSGTGWAASDLQAPDPGRAG